MSQFEKVEHDRGVIKFQLEKVEHDSFVVLSHFDLLRASLLQNRVLFSQLIRC